MTVWYVATDFKPEINEVVQTGCINAQSGMGTDGGGPGWVRRYFGDGLWSGPVYIHHYLSSSVIPSNLVEVAKAAPMAWRRW